MEKDLVALAEDYCVRFHGEQKREGGNQEPFASHPFAVRDILVKYGYDEPETQAIALLHDTIEYTRLGENKNEIKKKFGTEVSEGVCVLSKNTAGEYAHEMAPLSQRLGIRFIEQNGILTPEAYKIRLLVIPGIWGIRGIRIQRVKIADTIHNTYNLPDLDKAGIERKLYDSETFYIPLGGIVAPVMVKELIENIGNYKASAHYRELFGQGGGGSGPSMLLSPP